MIRAIPSQIDPPTLRPEALVPMLLEKRCDMPTKTVLLVDDDSANLTFTLFALKRMDSPPALQYAANGFQGMQYLEGVGRFADRRYYPLPDLILLDLKMPVMDGFEILRWIRGSSQFSHLPVIILTGSTYPPDLAHARELGANAFVEKTAELLDFGKNLRAVLAQNLQAPNLEPAKPKPKHPIESTIASAIGP